MSKISLESIEGIILCILPRIIRIFHCYRNGLKELFGQRLLKVKSIFIFIICSLVKYPKSIILILQNMHWIDNDYNLKKKKKFKLNMLYVLKYIFLDLLIE